MLGVVSIASSARAEEFVRYNEARPMLETKPSENDGSVSVDELRALQGGGGVVQVFDARSKAEFGREHIAAAKLPHEEAYYRDVELFQQQIVREAPDAIVSLERSMAGLPKNAEIVTYCNRNCGISKTLKRELEDLGFTNVRWLVGGIDDWREKGYPLEKT